jgi:hypothetical protein
MDRKRLQKIRREAESLRDTQAKAAALQRLARRLGREKVNRGKEPMYESEPFPNLRPLSIPMHKGRDMPTGTKNSILNQLEEDIDAWHELITKQGRENGGSTQ